MRKWPSGWPLLIWGILGFLMLLSGVISGNLVTVTVGAIMAFAVASAYLTSYVKSEHRVKKASEVVSAIVVLAILVYGYVITGSFILEVMTLFIVAMFFFAFVVSYLLPRIRSRSKSLAHEKEEGKEKGDFAYDVGREQGREMRKGLEENWKSYVIASVIAIGCGLLLISLKAAWFIVGLSAFISYGIAYYSLSELFKIKK